MQKATVIFIFLMQAFYGLNAQKMAELKGSVTDTTGTPLSGATVRLVSGVDTLTTLTVSNGTFHFKHLAGSITLLVTMKGYADFIKTDSIPAQRNIAYSLPPIVLEQEYSNLNPVTIFGVKPIRIAQDTIEYYAAAFPVHAGDELKYLIMKFPGLQILPDGTIIFQGKKITKIMVNGKDFTGGDMATAINNLPSDIVESIQFIDDYGDESRLTGVKNGNADKTLNIVLKQDKRWGKFGRIELGRGTKDKYNTGLFADEVKGDRQLTLNIYSRDTIPLGNDHETGVYLGHTDIWNKWSGNGGLGVWGGTQLLGSSLMQNVFIPGNTTYLEQINQTTGSKLNESMLYTIEYRPVTGALLRLTPTFQILTSSNNSATNMSSTQIDSNFEKNTKGNSLNLGSNQLIYGGAKLYYEKTFPSSEKRFSFTVGQHYTSQRQGLHQQTSTLVSTDSIHSLITADNFLHTNIYTQELNAGFSYYLPLKQSSFIELSYTPKYTLSRSNKITQTPDSIMSRLITIDSLSNTYSVGLLTQDIRTGYLLHTKKFDLTTSLDAQVSTQNNQINQGKTAAFSTHYFYLLPLIQLSWRSSPNSSFDLNYRSSTQLPTLQQLQPVTDLTNPQYPVTGNPFLKPSYAQIINFDYEQSTAIPAKRPSFGIQISYSTVDNMIIQSITNPKDSSLVIQNTTYVNKNGFYTFDATYHLESPTLLNKRFRIAISGEWKSEQVYTLLDNLAYRTNTYNWNQQLRFNLDIPNVIECEWAGNYMLSMTKYPGNADLPTSYPYAYWSFTGRNFLLNRWIISYGITQTYTSGSGKGLQSNPTLLNGAIQRQFLANNQLTIRISANNILNSTSGISEAVTPTSVTQNNTTLVGRYFLLSLIWKFETFHH